jgi:hypothetical protein
VQPSRATRNRSRARVATWNSWSASSGVRYSTASSDGSDSLRIFVLTVRNWPSSPASLPGGSQLRYFVSDSRPTSSASTHSLREQNRKNSQTPVITAFADFSIRKRGGDDTRGLRGGSGSSTSQRRNRARSSSVICFQSRPRSEHQVSSRAERMPYAFSVLNDRPMSRNEARNRQDSW